MRRYVPHHARTRFAPRADTLRTMHGRTPHHVPIRFARYADALRTMYAADKTMHTTRENGIAIHI
ncbi:MAG: hypothetical protein K2M96_09055 [Prevotella sp.]|nr:hypothetical protein [Prevotella sp.]